MFTGLIQLSLGEKSRIYPVWLLKEYFQLSCTKICQCKGQVFTTYLEDSKEKHLSTACFPPAAKVSGKERRSCLGSLLEFFWGWSAHQGIQEKKHWRTRGLPVHHIKISYHIISYHIKTKCQSIQGHNLGLIIRISMEFIVQRRKLTVAMAWGCFKEGLKS